MKIRKIILENNTFFGNQEFSFEDNLGNIYNNIVLAGENGNGKTQLLNIIYDLCDVELHGPVNSEIRKIYISFSQEELEYINQNLRIIKDFSNPTGNFMIELDFSALENTWDRVKIKYEKLENDGGKCYKELNSSWFFNDIDRHFLFRSIFSTVEINYDPGYTSMVTAKDVDIEIKRSIRSNTGLASEIQQLLIDIQTNDANDLSTWFDKHPDELPPKQIRNVRINRFKRAFATIFDNLNFSEIINNGSNKIVLFKKDNHDISIGALSSGEKQIVFRGAFLLQNQNSSKGCCILIDEPEISLHPIWQRKIYDYYKNLFIDITGNQTSQIFMATHSQYVLKSALDNPSNTLILLLKNSNSGFSVSHISTPLILPTITAAEINYNAFNIVSNDYHIELYGYLQSIIGNGCSVKDCDEFIKQHSDYDAKLHYKPSCYTNSKSGHKICYETLPTYIRNAIDHPDSTGTFTDDELQISIELLMRLCR